MPADSGSPWYFRQRFALFGVVYGFGFFFGYAIAGFTSDIRPAYVLLSNAVPALSLHGSLWVAALCCAFGYLWRLWGSSYLDSRIVWSDEVQVAGLRIGGPYRFTRNPLYFGNLFMGLGIGLLGPWEATLLIVLGNLVLAYVLSAVEERTLLRAYGEPYARYVRAVPRLVPVVFRSAPAANAHGSLARGLATEWFMGAFTLAALATAIAGRPVPWLFAVIFVVAFAAHRLPRAAAPERA